MFHNLGRLDRIGRIVLGLALLAMVMLRPGAWWGLVGVLPLISAFRGNCPVYSVLGLSTRRQAPERRTRGILEL